MATLQLPPLPNRFAHAQAADYLKACEQIWTHSPAAAPGAVWELPAGALQSFDSSVLAVCLSLSRQAQSKGARLRLQDCPLRLQDLSSLYGVKELLAA